MTVGRGRSARAGRGQAVPGGRPRDAGPCWPPRAPGSWAQAGSDFFSPAPGARPNPDPRHQSPLGMGATGPPAGCASAPGACPRHWAGEGLLLHPGPRAPVPFLPCAQHGATGPRGRGNSPPPRRGPRWPRVMEEERQEVEREREGTLARKNQKRLPGRGGI